ncbi:hypothetical protein ITJ57_18885 [Plantibacter sp. VKM Ac-2880]|uniref:hypothetical protein n=1 Tax=Plantibacter sp. VKM Ac-2880 TaxID=2783827 RepID=UPI00189037F0|nr:hypothetical protein [Plantibacter sp. VKM Ac-2880]MBF4570840.1 hypothetical protein [Plantibacter sp. VKM Ac-2880]
MGNAVYEERSNDRWAGYGVPAVCDLDGCTTGIDRGLGYKCEAGHADEDAWLELPEDQRDPEFEDSGCGLFFCTEHLYRAKLHADATAKPDTAEWNAHMLTDESWRQWREENPARVEALQLAAGSGTADLVSGS